MLHLSPGLGVRPVCWFLCWLPCYHQAELLAHCWWHISEPRHDVLALVMGCSRSSVGIKWMTKVLCSSSAEGKGTRWSFIQGESLLLSSGNKMSMICTRNLLGCNWFYKWFFFFFLAIRQGTWDLSYPTKDQTHIPYSRVSTPRPLRKSANRHRYNHPWKKFPNSF